MILDKNKSSMKWTLINRQLIKKMIAKAIDEVTRKGDEYEQHLKTLKNMLNSTR